MAHLFFPDYVAALPSRASVLPTCPRYKTNKKFPNLVCPFTTAEISFNPFVIAFPVTSVKVCTWKLDNLALLVTVHWNQSYLCPRRADFFWSETLALSLGIVCAQQPWHPHRSASPHCPPVNQISFAIEQCCKGLVFLFHSYFLHFQFISWILILEFIRNKLRSLSFPFPRALCNCFLMLFLSVWFTEFLLTGSWLFTFVRVSFVRFEFALSLSIFLCSMTFSRSPSVWYYWCSTFLLNRTCSTCLVVITEIRCLIDYWFR